MQLIPLGRSLHSGKRCACFFRAFTLMELLVTVAIIAVLGALFMPAVNGVLERARRAECSSHLKQIALGMSAYLQDNEMTFPVAYQTNTPNWRFSLVRGGYLGSPDVRDPKVINDPSQWRPEHFKVMGCPSARRRSNKTPPFSPTYAMNGHVGNGKLRALQLTEPMACWMVTEGTLAASGNYGIVMWARQGANSLPGEMHDDFANVLFCDGHVESLAVDQFPSEDTPGNSRQWFFWNGQPYHP